MAEEDQANLEFTHILCSLDRKFEIIHAKWSEDKLFEIKFRTQIQQITNTIWVKKISNTGPKIRFRKQYQCWTQEGKVVQKELLFDARRCRGTLDMKVLTDNPQTRRKNKHIKLGLNVVVKINFTHLHKVNTSEPYAFFVHTCKPQAEPPKPNIQPNDNLPKLVAEMVQKGLNASPKVVNPNPPNPLHAAPQFTQTNTLVQANTIVPPIIQTDTFSPSNPVMQSIDMNMTKNIELPPSSKNDKQENRQPEIQMNNHLNHQLGPIDSQQLEQKIIHSDLLQSQLHVQNLEQIQLSQVLPLQGMESIKLELQPQLQQLTQVVVSGPQLEMTEPLLMCQPTLMFDPTQVIPVTHTLPPHFVQVHSHNLHNQQGHYL